MFFIIGASDATFNCDYGIESYGSWVLFIVAEKIRFINETSNWKIAQEKLLRNVKKYFTLLKNVIKSA